MLGRGALPQKALESTLKTAAFPKNLEEDVSLRFGELGDAVVMQPAAILGWNLCQSWGFSASSSCFGCCWGGKSQQHMSALVGPGGSFTSPQREIQDATKQWQHPMAMSPSLG